MNRKEIRPRDFVEVPPVPITKENVAKQMLWTTAKFIVDVVYSPNYSGLHIVSNERLWTNEGEALMNVKLREMMPIFFDLARAKEVQQKAAAFEKEFGKVFNKNPDLFLVDFDDRALILDYARNQGRLPDEFLAALIDWKLTR